MSNLVIVAIPEDGDEVWRVSSEKVPHMTLLFLGEDVSPEDSWNIRLFLAHAAETALTPFWMEVDRRGELGDDKADVLFFRKDWDFQEVSKFRDQLLLHDKIKKAYLSVEQFPHWTPHLTLGYPETPAKKIDDDRRIFSVRFDRLALWTGDYEGPEWRLTYNHIPAEQDIAMNASSSKVEELLHYGVKGMKWGHRKDNVGQVTTKTVITKSGKTKIKADKGAGQPASKDAIRKVETKQKLKKSGTNALSDKELSDLARRLQLEKQVNELTAPAGKKFVMKLLGQTGQQQAQRVANEAAAQKVNDMMKKKAA